MSNGHAGDMVPVTPNGEPLHAHTLQFPPYQCPTCQRCPTCGKPNYPYQYWPTITWTYDPNTQPVVMN